jgi:ferric iron reductase protein FhuF
MTVRSSSVAHVFEALRHINPSWTVELGRPVPGDGWISGAELVNPSSGPLHELLQRIGARVQTADRRTIAALYAMRFGWASAMAIAPYVKFTAVPDVSLENVSLKFTPSTFLERMAIHEPSGVAGKAGDRHLLRQALRQQLTAQAVPVVEALHQWSGFAPRGTWGMLTSSWAAHLINLSADGPDQRGVLPELQRFFEGDDLAAVMQPRVHPVTYRDATHLYQRRASCCRFYLVPEGELCASCPLVSQEERIARNVAWMKQQLDGTAGSRGHR